MTVSGCCSCCRACNRRASERFQSGLRTADTDVRTLAAEPVSGQWDGTSGPYLQQVMPGWQAPLTWAQMSLCLVSVAIIHGCLAGFSYVCWSGTDEITVDYTNCANSTTNSTCQMEVQVKRNMTSPVYLYYSLSGAYFNHRRIATAWSMRQMIGLPPSGNLTKVCREHAYREGQQVLPCGALSDAIFNDTFAIIGPLEVDNSSANSSIPMSASEITWPSLSRGLYRPLTTEQLSDTVQPVSWPQGVKDRYQRPFSDAEDLHVWLRTPAFIHFRKISQRILQDLQEGRYRLEIGNNFPVSSFGGNKRVIIATMSLLGGKNFPLFILLAITSGCYLLLTVFTMIRCMLQCRCKATK